MDLVLNRDARKARVLSGHPWVYQNEVFKKLGDEYKGQGVSLIDTKGKFLGSGIYNPDSQIAWRRYSRHKCKFDESFIRKALSDAISFREAEPVRRLVWSEADHLPGLIVDQYEDVLVVQLLTAAMDKQEAVIATCLSDLLSPSEIIFRNDAPVRLREKLEQETHTLSGDDYPVREFTIDGLTYLLDLQKGHKTGFYLDQRKEHQRIAAYAESKKVLDCFCNQGAFALQCAKAGAESVTGVDISEDCMKLALENATRNSLDVTFHAANVFDYFTSHKGQKFDLIILDPPSFAKNKASLPGALRGYKELTLRALRMLNPGGILATYSCSQHVSSDDFERITRQAAADAKKDCRLLARTGQPSDHPIDLLIPESEYLKGFILQVS